MSNSLLDGLQVFWIGILVVFIVLILLLLSIKVLTFFETENSKKEIIKNKLKTNEKDGNLFDIAAAIGVSIFTKSKNKTNEIAAAAAVSIFENDNQKLIDTDFSSYNSPWITINRSRMMQKKTRRI